MPQEEKERVKQQVSLVAISAAIMIVVAQLNFNLIINGFKISLAVICLPIFAFLLENFPSFPVTLVTAPGIMLVRSVFEWLDGGSFLEAVASYSPEMLFYLIYGGLFSIYVRLVPISHFRPVRLLPLIAIDMVSNISEIFVRLGPNGFSVSVTTTPALRTSATRWPRTLMKSPQSIPCSCATCPATSPPATASRWRRPIIRRIPPTRWAG